jgi:hypothetical protein
MWRRLASFACVLAVAAAAAAATPADSVRSGELEQAWYRLTQELETHSQPGLAARSAELTTLASRVSLERLTPFALALVARSRSVPRSDAENLLEVATNLDPGCAEAHLGLAAIRLRRWALAAGVTSALRAIAGLVTDGRFTQLLLGSAAIALVCALAVAFGLWSLLVIRRIIPALWHDLMEMGGHWRLGPNGLVVGFVALALPLFAGGDVVWLALWLLALSWAYVSRFARVTMAAGVLLVAAAPTIVEVGF